MTEEKEHKAYDLEKRFIDIKSIVRSLFL
jgi:hypothetical protein